MSTATVHPVSTARSALARRLSDRRQQRQLRRELAGYNTPAARADLNAMLARHSDEESAPIRRLISQHPAREAKRFG